jgi:deoxyadenosine/deoxycytidine kinase
MRSHLCEVDYFGHNSNLILWLSGPTGAGKSTLAHALRVNGWSVQSELVSSKFLADFQRDPERNCFKLQKHIMDERKLGWDAVSGCAKVAIDRTIGEDFEVFCKLHHENGFLSDGELQLLRTQANALLLHVPKPDLIVLITADLTILAERLKSARSPQLIIDTLPRQLELYEQWARQEQSPILRLDTSKTEPDTLSELIGEICCG